MKTNQEPRKDWRDSKLVQFLAYALAGAVAFGSLKAYQYLDSESNRRFESKYGWLRDYPAEYQRAVISSNVNQELPWWSANQTTRNWVCDLYFNNLKKPEH